MAEKKNLVIKVKYPTSAKTRQALSPNAAVITVWNIRRIALAVVALLGLIGFLILVVYAFSGDDAGQAAGQGGEVSQNAQDTNGQTLEPTAVAEKKSGTALATSPNAASTDKPVTTAKLLTQALTVTGSQEPTRVRRAVLATRIVDKEPSDVVAQGVSVAPSRLTTVYYFNELRGMNGKILYHEWLRNGVSVVKEPLQVGAERWRVSSHKTFDEQAAGTWTVKLLDDTGKVLDEKSFVVSVGQ
ncbi:MAG: DUF2914 domain-containing protein [Methylovulum sp.]|nr:DUF2914 domain-containing protein [Methylovulum sp.]